MKRQDMVVLAKLCEPEAREMGYAALGASLALSASETHAAVKRLRECGLLDGHRTLAKRNALEFLSSGLRYVFPLRSTGEMARGVSTGWAGPGAAEVFAGEGLPPVWACEEGETLGVAVEPLYPTVPRAALEDPALHRRLALFDLLRGGRIREQEWARKQLEAAL